MYYTICKGYVHELYTSIAEVAADIAPIQYQNSQRGYPQGPK